MLDIASRISASVCVFNDPQRNWAPRDRSITAAQRIGILTSNGFGVETWLTRWNRKPLDEKTITSLAEACRSAWIVSAHTSTHAWSPEKLREEIRLTARLHASILVVHPNTLGFESQREPPPANELRDFCSFALKNRVTLALENSGRTGIEMMRHALDHIGDPISAGLRVCVDTGHANRSRALDGAPAEAYLEEFRGLIIEVHVNDNLGDRDLHLPPSEGTVNWAAVIPAMRQLREDAVICLEIAAPGDPVEVLKAARELLCRT